MPDQLPEIGLNPQARATDQFARPEVRRTLAGNQLMQVAGALKDFSNDAKDVFDRRQDAMNRQSEAQADQIFASHANVYKNQQELKGAVDRGEIPGHANPWLMVRLKQDVARSEVTTASSGIYNDLRQSPVFHGDSPQAVQSFISDRYAQLSQGRDSWQIAAMHQEMQQQQQKMLGDWTEQRGQERMNEARTATGAAVLQKVNDHLGDTLVTDPAAAGKLPALTADLQDNYNHLLQVTDKATASKWLSDAAFQAGRIHRSADLTRAILDGVKGQDGLKLSDLADNKANLETLPREIMELKNADDQAYITGRQLTGAKERSAMMDAAIKSLKPGQTLNDATFTAEQWQKMSPEGFAEAQRFLATMSQETLNNQNARDQMKVNPELGRLLAGSINGTLKMPDRISALSALALTGGQPGREGVETTLRAFGFMRNVNYGETTPQTTFDLNKKSESGTLSMNDVLDRMQNGTLDRESGQTWMKLAAQQESLGAKYNGMVNEVAHDLSEQIASPYQEKGELGGIGNTEATDKMHADQAKAEAAFRSEFYGRLTKAEGWDQLSFAEQQKQVRELSDSIAKTYHGQDYASWLKDRPEASKDIPSTPYKPTPAAEPAKLTVEQQRQSIAVDPFTVDLNKDILSSTRKALGVKTDANIREVVEAWDSHLKAPPNIAYTGFPTFQGQPLITPPKQGEAIAKLGLDKFTDLRQIRASGFPSFYRPDSASAFKSETLGEFHTTSIRKGNMEDTEAGRAIQDREGQLWNASMAKLQSNKADAMQAKDTIRTISQQFSATGKITPEQQANLRSATIQVMAFQELRDQVGYTPAEVKEAGEGAWRSMPMFANPNDLKERGGAVATELGLKAFQIDSFKNAQTAMLKLIREKDQQ